MRCELMLRGLSFDQEVSSDLCGDDLFRDRRDQD